MKERNSLRIVFRGAKTQFNSITELAAQEQEEREATEFELEKINV